MMEVSSFVAESTARCLAFATGNKISSPLLLLQRASYERGTPDCLCYVLDTEVVPFRDLVRTVVGAHDVREVVLFAEAITARLDTRIPRNLALADQFDAAMKEGTVFDTDQIPGEDRRQQLGLVSEDDHGMVYHRTYEVSGEEPHRVVVPHDDPYTSLSLHMIKHYCPLFVPHPERVGGQENYRQLCARLLSRIGIAPLRAYTSGGSTTTPNLN